MTSIYELKDSVEIFAGGKVASAGPQVLYQTGDAAFGYGFFIEKDIPCVGVPAKVAALAPSRRW